MKLQFLFLFFSYLPAIILVDITIYGDFIMKQMKTNEITEGIIWKQLLFFFFPILLGSFFQQLYNTVDAVVVGRFVGKNALAAVGGSAGMIVNLVVSFFTGLTSGASVIVSQFFGQQNKDKVNEGIHSIYAFTILGSAVITALGILLSPALLSVMNTPEELMTDSILYLRIYFAGIFFTFMYNTGSSLLRALGDARRPLYCLIVCCLINVGLDLLMVLGLGLGIAGVAIATMISQAISAVIITFFMLKSKELCQFSLRKIRVHGEILKSELYLGFPGGLQGAMYSISNMIIQSALNKFGTDTAAAWAAYGKMDAIVWMVSGAFGIAITTFVGQNFGAGKTDRIKKSIRICIGMNLAASLLISILLISLRSPLFHIFVTDTAVVEIGCRMLMMISPFYAFFVFTEILSGALRGMGDVVIPMFITTGSICVLRIIWILFLVPLRPTLSFTLLNYPVSWILSAVLFVIYYLWKIKKKKEMLA